jgi:hypothetical protein
MGLKERLETEGSKFTYSADGAVATPYTEEYVPPTNVLATKASALHATEDGEVGYSLTGANPTMQDPAGGSSTVTDASARYKDGNTISDLPNASTLDLDGGFGPNGKYEDNAPEGANF